MPLKTNFGWLGWIMLAPVRFGQRETIFLPLNLWCWGTPEFENYHSKCNDNILGQVEKLSVTRQLANMFIKLYKITLIGVI